MDKLPKSITYGNLHFEGIHIPVYILNNGVLVVSEDDTSYQVDKKPLSFIVISSVNTGYLLEDYLAPEEFIFDVKTLLHEINTHDVRLNKSNLITFSPLNYKRKFFGDFDLKLLEALNFDKRKM